MLKDEQPIGIFDSGIGGLTVAHAIKELLPNEQLLYFGDTAHLPYGDKEPYSIKHYSVEIAKFLLEKKAKVIVMACHTASSIAFEEVKRVIGNRAIVLNVVDPIIESLKTLKNEKHKIGVIGTKGTINSKVYPRKIKSLYQNLEVSALATPLLCPMIEEGFIDDRISQAVIDSYLGENCLKQISHIVLACTHYPLIKKQIAAYYQNQVRVIDPAEEVAQLVKSTLSEKGLCRMKSDPEHHFFVSDFTQSFEKSTRFFFGEKVKLEKGSIWS
ncbi:MAG: glutamate racemase [Vicingaceae bacterium]